LYFSEYITSFKGTIGLSVSILLLNRQYPALTVPLHSVGFLGRYILPFIPILKPSVTWLTGIKLIKVLVSSGYTGEGGKYKLELKFLFEGRIIEKP
jgi:hypothetical protein